MKKNKKYFLIAQTPLSLSPQTFPSPLSLSLKPSSTVHRPPLSLPLFIISFIAAASCRSTRSCQFGQTSIFYLSQATALRAYWVGAQLGMDGDSHRERRIGFSYLVLAVGIGLIFLNWVLQQVVGRNCNSGFVVGFRMILGNGC